VEDDSMSVKVEFENGYIGTVSEKVAEKLEAKGAAKVIDVADKAKPKGEVKK
jgi:hypothetical protein